MSPKARGEARELESFGVAGVLSDECRVYYNSIFSTQQIGKVSDLFCARLRETALDELRFRAVMLLGAFEVLRTQIDAVANPGEHRLREPLVIECGVDDERIAIGISFKIPEDRFPKLDELAERLAGTPTDAFEFLLKEMYVQSDHVILRAQPSQGRVEIVSILAIGESEGDKAPVEVVQLESNAAVQTPPAGQYQELGDVDYAELLRERAASDQGVASPSGEVVANGFVEGEAEMARIRSNHAAEDAGMVKVTGRSESADGVAIVKGGSQSAQSEAFVVKGGEPELEGIPAYGSGPQANLSAANQLIEALEKRLQEFEDEYEVVDEEPTSGEKLKGILKKVWPFKNARDTDLEEEKLLDEEEVSGDESQEEGLESDAESESGAEGESEFEGDPQESAEELVESMQTGSLSQTLERVQKELPQIRRESATAKKWADGLMEELVMEKSRLAKISKKLNQVLRVKDLEMRNREALLNEELRKRDEMVRQKTAAIGRLKEQITQVSEQTERLRTAKTSSSADEVNYKQMHVMAQKMLKAKDSEMAAYKKKVDDLRAQLMKAQAASNRNHGPSTADYMNLQSRYERMAKQVEEMRKAQAAVDKAAKLDKNPQVALEETRKRLEAAMKLATMHEKDLEQARLKLEDSSRENLRLKKELLASKKGSEAA